jgi:hypothetical protein
MKPRKKTPLEELTEQMLRLSEAQLKKSLEMEKVIDAYCEKVERRLLMTRIYSRREIDPKLLLPIQKHQLQ